MNRFRGAAGLFRVTAIFYQSGYNGLSPNVAPGGSANMHLAMQMEAERRKSLDEETRARFVVVKEEQRKRTGRVIGIDLGTTNSCISYIDDETRRPKVIPSPTGSWVYPTAITFDKNHQVRLFGEEARACVRTSASATLCSGKRLIGRGYGELGRVQSQLNRTNILTLSEKGEVAVEIMGRTYTIVHITAMFLRYLKQEAENYLKEPVDLVVVSVPAYFTPQQKVATEDAALAAGFDVLEVIDEPSAACLTYTVLNKRNEPTELAEKRIRRSLVFDLGGGTLDCAIMEHDSKKNMFKLVATHGDPLLGGNDWDNVLSMYFTNQFETKWRVPIEEEEGNLGQGVAAYRNLLLEAEKAKIHFTHSTEPYYGYNRAFHFSEKLRDIIPLEATLTHEQYVDMTRPLRVRCVECLNKLFEHSGIKPSDIDHVLLVGAMTRDPPLRGVLEDYFGKTVASESACPADYAVALGAAIRGGMLQGRFPDLSANTRFVSGTVQSQRSGSILERTWSTLTSYVNPQNPNAIGQRWRGSAKGLTDEEIAQYAKELVEFEAQNQRRLLLERTENEANFVMRRVTADSNKRQGMQEKRVAQLAEQLKFWQYMVHNFHDHEEELLRTVRELEKALDELDGLAKDNTSHLTDSGTIDFSKAGEIIDRNLGKEAKKKESDAGVASPAKSAPSTADAQSTATPIVAAGAPSAGSSHDIAGAAANSEAGKDASAVEKDKPSQTQQRKGPKVLRRTVPLPKASSETEELVEAGHPALRGVDVSMSESTRRSLFVDQVEERAWREPPTPPGEQGSWKDVKNAMDAGESVGLLLPDKEVTRQMNMEEMHRMLMEISPIDDPPSPEHYAMQSIALDLQTITIVENNVDIGSVLDQIEADEAASEVAELKRRQQVQAETEQMSASLYR